MPELDGNTHKWITAIAAIVITVATIGAAAHKYLPLIWG
jgi:hypothetical protein